MKQFIIILFCILSFMVHAEIQVQVNPSQISAYDSFQLTISQGQAAGGSLNLSALQQDFNILGTQQSNMYSITNGKVQSSRHWIISLSPKKTGLLTIPSIQIGTEHSKPLTINVSQGKARSNQTISTTPINQKEVFIKTSVNVKNPLVNQQIIYTIKLFNSKRLLDVDFQGPSVEDALLIPLGNGKRYQVLQNNVDYVVEEQNYALFPQKSGPLKINSPRLKALVYDFDLHKVSAEDKPIELTVLPIPQHYKGQDWLPAKKLTLSDSYEDQKTTFSQGSTLIRHVTMEGEAIPAQFLPQLRFSENDAVSVYPEKGKEKNQIKQGELVGSTSFKLTYLFKKPGKMMIPAIKISWFNTATGKEEMAVLPPKSIEITPSATGTLQAPKMPEINKTPAAKESQVALMPTKAPRSSTPWILLAIALAIGWLLTLFAWLMARKRRHGGKQKAKAFNKLAKACLENNPQKARDALIKWASFQWPDAFIFNLNDVNQLTKDPQFKKQLHLLSEALYSEENKTAWRGIDLLQSIKHLKPVKGFKKKKNHDLPPMNPS